MVKYKCTQCGWSGSEEELKKTFICPECFTGHSPLYPLMKIAGKYVCPNCDWKGSENNALLSPECPKCSDEYLIKID